MADAPPPSLAEWRARKDEFLKSSRGSPLRGAPGFEGLTYYPEEPAARVVARVERPPAPTIALLTTSTGEEREFVEYGIARFPYGGQELGLMLFAPASEPDGPRLFLPFADATSGNETYGAGRYLDLLIDRATEAPPSNVELVIDFNYAYHPLCAYAEGYSCPFPPPSNRLPVAVRAGERLPPGRAR